MIIQNRILIFNVSFVDLDLTFIISPPPKENKIDFLKIILQRQPCIASGGKIPLIFVFVNATNAKT